MGDYYQYYENRTRDRRDSNPTDYYYSRSGPVRATAPARHSHEHYIDSPQHHDGYSSPPSRRSVDYRASTRDLTRYDDIERSPRSLSREVIRYSESDERRRSLSPSQRPRHHHSHDHDHHHEHDRGHRHEREHYTREHEEHSTGKDVAATIIGGIVGSQAGKRASHGNSKTGLVAGALIGALGGHELEKGWEHHEAKERRRS